MYWLRLTNHQCLKEGSIMTLGKKMEGFLILDIICLWWQVLSWLVAHASYVYIVFLRYMTLLF